MPVSVREKSLRPTVEPTVEPEKPKSKARALTDNQLVWEFTRVSGPFYMMLLILGCAIMVARGADFPMLVFVFRDIYDAFRTADILGNMRDALFQQITIGGGVFVASVIGLSIFGYGGEQCLLRVRVAVLRALLTRRAAYFHRDGNAPAQLITDIDQMPPYMKAVVDARFWKLIHNLASCLTCLALSFYFCWMVCFYRNLEVVQVASLGFGIFLVVVAVQTGINVYIALRKRAAAREDTPNEHAVEVIENIRTIQILTAEEHFLARYNVLLAKELRADVITSILQGIYLGIAQPGLVSITFAGAFGLGTRLIHNGKFIDTDVFMSATSLSLMMFALGNGVPYLPDIIKVCSSERLLRRRNRAETPDRRCCSIRVLLALRTPLDLRPLHPLRLNIAAPVKQVQNLEGEVVFDGVWFAYKPTEKSVLRGLSFTAKAGQTVALVGPSGCGKSTTVALIEQFYAPDRGQIVGLQRKIIVSILQRIDGKDLRSYDLTELREKIALVGQEPRTVMNNLTLGARDATMEDVVNACRIANAEAFIKALPEGYETDIGERGSRLSGGQKQRLAIARALVKNPRILLLDEATSALDSQSEKAVQEALEKAREGRTCITIAHRLSSIQTADVIFYLEAGRVRESGSHQQLMTRHAKYFHLVQNAKLGPAQ